MVDFVRRRVSAVHITRFWPIAGGVMFTVLSGCGDGSPQTRNGRPGGLTEMVYGQSDTLACDTPVWEIETPKVGQQHSHTFSVRNTADHPVRIESVDGGCGCLIITGALGQELVPGEQADIQVTVTPVGGPGWFTYTVRVITVPGERPLILALRGQRGFNPGLYSMPETVRFGTAEPGERRDFTLRLARHDGTPAAVIDIKSTVAAVSSTAAGPSASHDGFAEIRLSLDTAGLPPGQHSGTLHISTDHPDEAMRTLSVPLTFVVEPAVEQAPPQVVKLSAGGSHAARLTVPVPQCGDSDSPLTAFDGCSWTGEVAVITRWTGTRDGQASVELRPSGSIRKGYFPGRLELTREGKATISVPVNILVVP